MEYTNQKVSEILTEANTASVVAATTFFQEKLGGKDQYCCGFSWVEIYGIRANSKLGKFLTDAGIRKDSYRKCFIFHNETGVNCQNVDTKDAGSRAAAKVLTSYGFRAYATSRLD